MIKLSCPHCTEIGLVPDFLTDVSGWPIACHHCNQNYYAPVITHLKPIERQVNIECFDCENISRIELKYFDFLKNNKFSIFCSKCHNNLKLIKLKSQRKIKNETDVINLINRRKIEFDNLDEVKYNKNSFLPNLFFLIFCLSSVMIFLFQEEALTLINIIFNDQNYKFFIIFLKENFALI